nr:MAG TPA: hypothetical protein [Caudoviricetes sp.]
MCNSYPAVLSLQSLRLIYPYFLLKMIEQPHLLWQ